MVSLEGQEVQREKIKELDFNIQNVENHHGEQKELISGELKSLKRDIEQKNNLRLKRQKERLAELMRQEDSGLQRMRRTIEEMEKRHCRELEELDERHEKELLRLYGEHEAMQAEQQEYMGKLERDERKVLQDFTQNLGVMENNFQEQMFTAQEKFKKAKHKRERDQEKFEEVVSQMEEDYRTDIQRKKADLDGKMGRLTRERVPARGGHPQHEPEDPEGDREEQGKAAQNGEPDPGHDQPEPPPRAANHEDAAQVGEHAAPAVRAGEADQLQGELG